ncbi:MAG: hypothetical protein R3Y63_05865 [Eubacteriales bacterium]
MNFLYDLTFSRVTESNHGLLSSATLITWIIFEFIDNSCAFCDTIPTSFDGTIHDLS